MSNISGLFRGAQVWRLVATALLLILSLFFLYPTIRLSTMSEEDKIDNPDLEEKLASKSIKLGLDLSGGMQLLLEPDLVGFLSNKALKKDEALVTAIQTAQNYADRENEKDILEVLPIIFKRNNLNLTDYFSNLGGTDDEIIKAISKERSKAVEGALEVVRSRVDQFGVSEPTIQQSKSDRIIVELPGVRDAQRARNLIKETAILEFKLVRRPKEVSDFVDKMDRLLRENPDILATAYKGETQPDTLLPPSMEPESLGVKDTTASAKPDLMASKKDTIPSKTKTKAEIKESPKETTIQKKSEESPKETATKKPSETKKVTEAKKPEEPKKQEVSAAKLFGEDTSKGTAETEEKPEGEAGEKPFSGLVEVKEDVIMVPRSEFPLVKRIIQHPLVASALPRESELYWGSRDDTLQDGLSYRPLYLLNSKAELTGDRVSKANFGFGGGGDARSAGKPVVNMSFDGTGSRLFSQTTGANIGRRLAIVLNDMVYTAPVIKSKISNNAQITGIPNLDEAKMITIVLRAGSLPVPLVIKSEHTVGPSLGQDSIRMGIMSTIIGALLVIIFMIFYYKMAGVIADIAVIINVIALMAGMAAFHARLTLPGIAGIILTMGMAVDANVLIYERIREELRAGKTVRAAIDAGYGRAFVTIVDANVTTLITAAILYNFGSGAVKGFAVTLFMGILISMLTAIVVTRLIFEYLTSRRHYETLSI